MSNLQAAEERKDPGYLVASEISFPAFRNCGHHRATPFKLSFSEPMPPTLKTVPPHLPEPRLPALKEQDGHLESLGTVTCPMPPGALQAS